MHARHNVHLNITLCAAVFHYSLIWIMLRDLIVIHFLLKTHLLCASFVANHWWISSSECLYDVHLSGTACWSEKAICSLVLLPPQAVIQWSSHVAQTESDSPSLMEQKVPKWQLDKSRMTFRLCFAESKVKGAGWLGAESMNKRVMGGWKICWRVWCLRADACVCLGQGYVDVADRIRWVSACAWDMGGQRVQKGWAVLLLGRVFLPLGCSCFNSSRQKWPAVNGSSIKRYCVSTTMYIIAQKSDK